MAEITTTERLPFPLAKPNPDTFVTKTSEIGHNGEPLDEVLEGLDNISKESTQSEEDAIIYETDGGTQVGKIDANGADFANLKRGGQQVARISDLPTKDTSIGDTPSNTHVPTTKAVKEYVDANAMGDLPISRESTQSEDNEMVASNDAGTDTYAKVGSYGVKAKAYKKLNGDDAIPPLDTTIGDNPSNAHTPSTQAVKNYVDTHGGGVGNLPISGQSTESEDEEFSIGNDNGSQTYMKAGPYGIKAKAYLDLDGNSIESVIPPFFNGFPTPKNATNLKVLMVGNSFAEQPMRFLQTWFPLLGVTHLTFGVVVKAGCTLQEHWNGYDNETAYAYFKLSVDGAAWKYINPTNGSEVDTSNTYKLNDILKYTDWDIITFQQASNKSYDWSTVEPYILKLASAARFACPNSCVKIGWQQTWAYPTGYSGLSPCHNSSQEMYEKIVEVSKKVFRLGIDLIIPSGTVVQSLRQVPDSFWGNDLQSVKGAFSDHVEPDAQGVLGYSSGDFSVDGVHLMDSGNFAVCGCILQTLVNSSFNKSIRGVNATYLSNSDYADMFIQSALKAICNRYSINSLNTSNKF